MAKNEKEAMLQDLYKHADAHLPDGLGGPRPDPANAGETHPD